MVKGKGVGVRKGGESGWGHTLGFAREMERKEKKMRERKVEICILAGER